MTVAVSLIIVAVAAIAGVYVSWRAGRLDRLHTRLETARAALRATFSQPDFRASIDRPEGADELLGELESTAHQVFLARKFYNDAVAATIAARSRWLVRVFRLAGGAPIPEFFEIDDALAPGGMAEQGTDMPHLAR